MISFSNVSKSFGKQDVLLDVSFVVHPGERVGVVGPNGAGKSTIFEILTGSGVPDRGDVSVPGNAVLGYVHQQLDPHREDKTLLRYTTAAVPELDRISEDIQGLEHKLDALSGQEHDRAVQRLGDLQTEFEHRGGYTLRNRAEAALCGLGFNTEDFSRPFSALSGGWQMRAELARTLIADPTVLLLDEPTNYLDVPAVEWLRDFLRSYPGTLLLISHDRYLLNALTSVTLEVSDAQVTRYPGNYAAYVSERDERARQLLAAKRNQDRKREQIERFVERFRAKNTKASQVQSRVKMLESMEEIRVPKVLAKPPKIQLPPPPHSGVQIVDLQKAGVTYDGQKWVLHDIDVTVEKGEKIAVVGLNGMGKTTLLRALAGRLPLSEGRHQLGHKVIVGYQSQDFTDTMDPDKTVFATAREAATDRSDADVRALLGGFGFSGEAIEKKVTVLSGGEKVRLGLARILLSPCNFLVLDEPTTHLDITAREALEQALRDYAGTLCLVSHDIEFVRHIAEIIFAVGPDGLTKYHGDYAYYREKLARDAAASAAAEASVDTPASNAQRRKEDKRLAAERRQALYKLKKPLEARIAKAERRAEELEEEQAAAVERLSADLSGQEYADASRRLAQIREEMQTVTDEWEAASLELEELLAD